MPKWTNEQLEAINKDGTNIIVSAGAGSGKTAVLTERVITKIKKGIPVDHLLILTFTKAAANEMKERIRQAIKKENNLEQLDKLDSAYITTFDSYALSVVKKYHYLLNVSKNINIGNENIFKLEKNKILDNIFEDYYKSKNTGFMNLISDFCVKDDLEIRDYILNIRTKLDMKVDSEDYLNKYLDTYYNNINIDNLVSNYITLLMDKINILKELINDLSLYVDATYLEKLDLVLKPLLNSDNYIDIKSNLNFKLPQLPRGSEDLIKGKKDEISSLIKNLKELTFYSSELELRDSLISTKKYASIIIDILLKFDHQIKAFKFNNNIYEFNDIAILAIKILQNNEEVCNELKAYFNEILVDEYQDTSDIQETFINLIANNNVYMVGDIKQSIYRFRNANPYIFKNKYDCYSKHDGGEKIDLNKNFRSRNEVINNINLIFNDIMNDTIGGANYKQEHQMIFGNNSYINKEKSDMSIMNYEQYQGFNKSEIEAFIIASDIKTKIDDKYQIFDKTTSLLRDATYSDFVILMDRTTDFELYKKIFEYLNIPLSIYKDETLNNEIDTMVITNILCLIKAIREESYGINFKYLFTSIARSYLFRLSDQEIFDIIRNNIFYNNEIFNKCRVIANKLDYLTAPELLDLIISDFDIYNKLINIGNVEPAIIRLEYILNLSNELMNLGYDCYSFIDYLKEISEQNYDMKYSVNLGNIDAVKIMTIHKSKGLEYPICYFSGLYKTFNISDLKERMLFDNCFGIILPFYNEGIGETICKVMLKDRYIKEEISEKIRLFYVALTRAREKIIFVLPKCENNIIDNKVTDNQKLKYRSLKDIVDSLPELLDYTTTINLDEINLSKDYNLITNKKLDDIEQISLLQIDELNIDSKPLSNTSFSKKTNNIHTKEEQTNIELGLKIHEILENIDFHNPNFDAIENEFYRSKIKDLFSKLNNLDGTTVYQEYEFMYRDNNSLYHGIIDLMIEYNDHIDIIDYKLKNVKDSAYIEQLNGYKKYISTLTLKPISIYLYSILDSNLEKLT